MLKQNIRNHKSEIRNLRILYLSVNSSYSHSSLAYGQLRCLSEKHAPEWTWDIVECSINDNINDVLNQIRQKKPDLIVSTIYLFNRNFTLNTISKYMVLSSNTKIVLGGPEFLGNNERTLKQYSWISAIFRGDESSFPTYLNLITAVKYFPKKLKQIPGICFISENSDYVDCETAIYKDNLDGLPSPYAHNYINKNKPFMQIETSRGCPSKCSFCTSSLANKVQYYSLERVRSDLTYINNTGTREVRVLDRTFNIPSGRAVKLLKLFTEEFSDIRFHLEFNPSKLTDKIIEQLKKAPTGQFHIETGIQTFYSPALDAINRKSTQKTEEGLKKLINLKKIEIHADLIYALPEQTVESLFNDLRRLILLNPTEIQLEVLKILPGTQIARNKNIKYSPTTPYDVLSTTIMNLNDILQFSYLSKIIDSYYNVKATKKLFQFAVQNNSSFLEKFLLFASKRFSVHHGKPSPSVRFKLLFEFALETNNDILYSITLFTYFCAGFFQSPIGGSQGISNPAINIELIKKNKLQDILETNLPILWSDNKPTIDKPSYLTSFDYNAADIWLNPKTAVKAGDYKYLFLLSQGGMNKKVSTILDCRY